MAGRPRCSWVERYSSRARIGGVEYDSERQGETPVTKGSLRLPEFSLGYLVTCDCLLPSIHPLLSQVFSSLRPSDDAWSSALDSGDELVVAGGEPSFGVFSHRGVQHGATPEHRKTDPGIQRRHPPMDVQGLPRQRPPGCVYPADRERKGSQERGPCVESASRLSTESEFLKKGSRNELYQVTLSTLSTESDAGHLAEDV